MTLINQPSKYRKICDIKNDDCSIRVYRSFRANCHVRCCSPFSVLRSLMQVRQLLSSFKLLSTFQSSADGERVRLGSFRTIIHDVRGDVYAVDEKTIQIENFRYDGAGFGKPVDWWLNVSRGPIIYS